MRVDDNELHNLLLDAPDINYNEGQNEFHDEVGRSTHDVEEGNNDECEQGEGEENPNPIDSHDNPNQSDTDAVNSNEPIRCVSANVQKSRSNAMLLLEQYRDADVICIQEHTIRLEPLTDLDLQKISIPA